ncbi:MAG: hypothetical protein COA32_10715 [Fluviicola sp.]|nr:MAG: hypothetical protein COA32_10715 [Fluviicola sp.]
MANIRDLKKEVNNMVYDVVDECYSIQLFDESKKKDTDEFIDEVADFQEEVMTEINKATSKKEFSVIRQNAEKKAEEWVKKLNKLQK